MTPRSILYSPYCIYCGKIINRSIYIPKSLDPFVFGKHNLDRIFTGLYDRPYTLCYKTERNASIRRLKQIFGRILIELCPYIPQKCFLLRSR